MTSQEYLRFIPEHFSSLTLFSLPSSDNLWTTTSVHQIKAILPQNITMSSIILSSSDDDFPPNVDSSNSLNTNTTLHRWMHLKAIVVLKRLNDLHDWQTNNLCFLSCHLSFFISYTNGGCAFHKFKYFSSQEKNYQRYHGIRFCKRKPTRGIS